MSPDGSFRREANGGDAVAVALRRPAGRVLAPMQRPLWASQRMRPGSPLQNMALLTHLDGEVDHARLDVAFGHVVEHCDVLRTRIVDFDSAPRVFLDAQHVSSDVIDLEREQVVDWARDRAKAPIEMGVRGYDSVIIRHPDATTSWYLALHHTITDASASSMIFDATAAAYRGETVDTPSYYAWAATLAEPTKRRDTAMAHWQTRHDAPRLARLYRPVRYATSEAVRIPVPIPSPTMDAIHAGLSGDLKMLNHDLGWTTMLVTATAAYLHHIAGADEFSIGLPVHNRSDETSRRVIGPVMEVFPVDIVVQPGQSYRDLHKTVGRAVMRTLSHAVTGTAPTGDYAAVVNVIARAGHGTFGDIPASTEWIHAGAMEESHLLRVQLSAYSDDSHPALALDVNIGGADESHRERVPGHFSAILETLVRTPDATIGHSVMAQPEEATIRAWESARDFEPAHGLVASSTIGSPTIVDRIRANIAGSTSVVLRDGDDVWTGVELLDEVERLAVSLRRRGVTANTRVGIEIGRSAQAVIAILAVLFAGGSFVPLDVRQPERRRRDLAQRAGCSQILYGSADVELLDRRLDAPDSTTQHPNGVGSGPAPEDEAYLLFTSGSSGEPKGVPITHAGLIRYIRFATESYVAPETPPIVALFSSLSFDLTITSLFLPLVVAGAEMRVIRNEGPAALTEIANDTTLNWIKATPSHLDLLVRVLPGHHALATAVVGGEAFGSGLAQRLLDACPQLSIFNEYGPTEAVVGCMIHRVDPDRLAEHLEVPIGRPAPGVTLRVVGPELHRVPIGSVGELCISHAGLTTGYLGVDNDAPDSPFIRLDGVRFYRSGDLVRLADAETLVYLGRADEQVKVGGIRLEPTEVESALVGHRAIAAAAVRLWSPKPIAPDRRCTRCGLASNVPGISFDEHDVCSTCHDFDRVAPQTTSWFRNENDLRAKLAEARAKRKGAYDCLHLLSGGKDSTYALYRLVALGFVPYVLTLDNGFIADEAKDNVRRSVAELGLDHEFATSDSMNAIFRDSLERHSNVCHGCYKTIYTLATTRAVELGIPMIVTGLSRGQLFETRLIPQQFAPGRFDPDAIDRAVVAARKKYHRLDDGPNRLLDTSVFADDNVFDEVEYLDFYRYVDVELSEMLEFLDTSAPWVRPKDSGRSTNCLINAAGIFTHIAEQGYHNYAVPYAWDVRLGHKTRQEAIDELDDDLDVTDVSRLLGQIGYVPSPRQILTGWLELEPGHLEPSPAELRTFLSGELARHAIPTAFVFVDRLPLTSNGKLDTTALPPPQRVHRAAGGVHVAAETELEALVVAVWERVLQTEPISVDDDFFALGGDSLAALEMAAALEEATGSAAGDDIVFTNTTPRALAAALESARSAAHGSSGTGTSLHDHELPAASPAWSPSLPPPLSDGELSVLYEQARRPDDIMYNVGRVYIVHDMLDPERLAEAARAAAQLHVPLSWSYGASRVHLTPADAVDVEIGSEPMDVAVFDDRVSARHRAPIDLERGALLRCWIQPLTDQRTAVLFACHHVSIDTESFARLWANINDFYRGIEVAAPLVDYPTIMEQQRSASAVADLDRWRSADHPAALSRLMLRRPLDRFADGFLIRVATVSRRELLGRAGTTGFASVVTALAATLRRYSDGDRVEMQMITSSRVHPAAEPLIGYFLNTLPVVLDCPSNLRLDDLARRAGAVVVANVADRGIPARRIREIRQAGGATPPDLDVLIAFDDLSDISFNGARVEQRVLSNGAAVTDATFFVELRNDHIDLSLEYRADVIEPAAAERLLLDFDTMLRATIVEPDRTISDVELASPTSLLRGGTLDAPTSIVPRILEHLVAQPDAIAVESDGETLTWGGLGHRSSIIAKALIERGVRQGDRVIVSLDRSTDLVVSILAVLRAGAAYVPIDPTYPADRIHMIAESAGAAAALTAAGGSLTANDIDVRQTLAADNRREGSDEDADIARDDIAYVIYTSGSTGRPRGVPVTHAQLAASTTARATVYTADPDRFLVVSSAAFDSSVVGLFWTLWSGGTIVLPTDRQVHDPDALIDLLDGSRISHALMVPTLYHALLERGSHRSAWPAHVIVAGEACPAALVARHFELRPGSALTNEYGPTEATVWATAHHFVQRTDRTGNPDVPVGTPIPGTWVAVVDREDLPVPVGVEGQLVIGGAGVVDGYLDTSLAEIEATESKFGTNSDGRFFRTGDRAVISDDTVWFLGRIDDQLNVGGVRVEPEDIERVLGELAGVAAVVVSIDDPRSFDELLMTADPPVVADAMRTAARAPDPAVALIDLLRAATNPRAMRLVAHIEAAKSHAATVDELRIHAAQFLPPLWRPAAYGIHSSLPRTPNGKLDRVAARRLSLSEMRDRDECDHPAKSSADDRAAADEPAIERLRNLFATTLGVSSVDADASFFDLGGHSLLAIELLLGLERTFGVRVTVSSLFERPTPRQLADLLARLDRPEQFELLVPIQTSGTKPPIFGVHVLGVNAEFYRPLAEHLGTDQPLYGLGQTALRLDPTVESDVRAIAGRYVEELIRCSPTGPITLAAVSLGSVVAFEMAQLLRTKGRHVALVALFDARGPDARTTTLTRQERLATHARQLRSNPRGWVAGRTESLTDRWSRRLEIVSLRLRRAMGVRLPDDLVIRDFIEANFVSQRTYEFAPYDGPVVVFRAGDDPFGGALVDNAMGWRRVAVGPLDVRVIPGGHLTILAEPNVGELAANLSELIELALARQGGQEGTTRNAVESALAAALADQRLGSEVALLLDRRSTLDPEAQSLLDRCDVASRAIASSTRRHGQAAVDALVSAGVSASLGLVPSRQQHCSALISLDGGPGPSGDDVDRAVRVLTQLGYVHQLPRRRPAGAAVSDGSCTLVRPDATTTRLTLTWKQHDERRAAVTVFSDADVESERSSTSHDLGIYLGTPTSVIPGVLGIADVRGDDLVVDVGCGDGRVLVEAVRRFGCRARGVEIDPRLAAAARTNIEQAGLGDRIEIVEDDALADDRIDVVLADATVVFTFLPIDVAAALLPRLLDRLPSGGRVLSHEQLAVDWPIKPDRCELVVGADALTVASLWRVT